MSSNPLPPDQGPSVRRIPFARWIEPAEAFDTLYAGVTHAVWLDAGQGAATGVSYLAGAHSGSRFVTASARAGTVTSSRPLAGTAAPETTSGSIFDFLRAELAGRAEATVDLLALDPPGSDPLVGLGTAFRLGWVGWLGYALARTSNAQSPFFEDLHGTPEEGLGDAAPDAALLFVDRAIAFDHEARTVTFLVGDDPGVSSSGAAAWVADTTRLLQARLSGATTAPPGPLRPTSPAVPLDVRWRHDPVRYAHLIAECQERITAGDAYQLCLTNEVTIPGRFDPLQVYRRLRRSSPSHHGGLLRFGPHALLSASPEQFLAVSAGGEMRTRPIKGTRPRSADQTRDSALEAELRDSPKERAENLMIVDLMRNDLGRVAELGSVTVTSLLEVESYPHVHQLVSTVEARLARGLTAVDAVESCFPAGSMTGAPKASAMGILHGLEGGERGVYAGAFGYFGLDGSVDLAMVIRSIVLGPTGASIGTGGGITALSVAHDEIEETRIKARALIEAIRASSSAPDPVAVRV